MNMLDFRYTLWYSDSMRRELTAIRLDASQMKALRRIGKREDRPYSWLIRKAIDEFVERDSKTQAAKPEPQEHT